MQKNHRFKLKNRTLFLSFVLTLLNVFIIVITEIEVLFSLGYTIFIFLVISLVLKIKKDIILNYCVLSFYILLGVLLYWLQYYLMPESYGFTGEYNGIGTDDSRFYAAVAYNSEFIPVYAARFAEMNHNFVSFLKLLYPFRIAHPLSIVIPNILGISFIPFFTKQAAEYLTDNKKVGNMAFILSLLCPLILSNGLILMRDGWTASLVIVGFYFLLKKQFIPYLIALLLLLVIRMGSGLILAFMPLFFFNHLIFSGSKVQKTIKVTFLFLIFGFTLLYGLPLINDYLSLKGINGLEREGFVETIIKKIDSSSVIYRIYSLPVYLKFPLGFVFFLLLPFFSPNFFVGDIFNIRGVLFTTIMPILAIFYFKYFVSGFLYAFKKNNKIFKKVYYIFFFSILLVSQASIQPRHKVTIMPIFYILVSYGIFNNNSITNKTGGFFAMFLLVLQFIMFVF